MHIVWEFEQVPYIQHTKIYTEITPGTFSPIAESSYSSSSFYSIANSELSPKSHQFAISTVDICNEESELSTSHSSMFLQIEFSEDSQMKLVWNSYVGAEIISYKILAGTHPDNLIEITEINSDITVYIGELSQYSVFCVVGVLSQEIESQSTIYSVVRSNIVDTRTEILSPQIKSYLFPNPCTDYVLISSDFAITNILIQNIQGIPITHIQPTELPIQINVQNLSTGMYFIKIEYANNTFECIQFTKE